MAFNGSELLDYACLKFQEMKYDEALEAFVLAHMKGLEPEWIIENIYDCYVTGNIDEFYNVFQRFGQKSGVTFEDCLLDFIPYKDGEYYIFDREENIFRGKFSVWELRKMVKDSIFNNSEFFDAALEMDWDWRNFQNVLVESINRKIYVVCQDCRRAASFYKIPELADYMDNVMLFADWDKFQEYFHQNTEIYLPKLFLGTVCSEEEFQRIIDVEHQYRLTPEGRNTNNILLTIGIPTHDRGNLLLKRLEHLRTMCFDAEIEIAISKHGYHYYQEEYEIVEEIKDARINYVGTDQELMMQENWRNVVKIAKGKFVIVVSDEDDVILESLENYMKLLKEHPYVGEVRSRTTAHYSDNKEAEYYFKGEAAFFGGFLKQNYLSGIIYNKKIFMSAGLDDWDLKYKDNAFYYLYPHMWWHVALSFLGDYIIDNHYLIYEGESVWKEETKKYEQSGLEEVHGAKDERPDIIDIVSSLEARLNQFKGAVLLISDCEHLNKDLKMKAYNSLIQKTLFLMGMVHNYYSRDEMIFWIERFVDEVISSIKFLQIDKEFEKIILKNLESNIHLFEKIYLEGERA